MSAPDILHARARAILDLRGLFDDEEIARRLTALAEDVARRAREEEREACAAWHDVQAQDAANLAARSELRYEYRRLDAALEKAKEHRFYASRLRSRLASPLPEPSAQETPGDGTCPNRHPWREAHVIPTPKPGEPLKCTACGRVFAEPLPESREGQQTEPARETIKERYARMAQSPWFKEAHEVRSLCDGIFIGDQHPVEHCPGCVGARRPAYDRTFGDDRECACGHTYERHFDGYEVPPAPVGCKYCDCGVWIVPGPTQEARVSPESPHPALRHWYLDFTCGAVGCGLPEIDPIHFSRCGAELHYPSSSANGGTIVRSCGRSVGHALPHVAFGAEPPEEFTCDMRTPASPSPQAEPTKETR